MFDVLERIKALEDRKIPEAVAAPDSGEKGDGGANHVDNSLFTELQEQVKGLDGQVQTILKELGNLASIKQQLQELQKKTKDIISKEDITKIQSTQKTMGDELKMTLAEIKLIKDQLNEFNSLKRQVSSLARGPTEAEMIKLKGRVDICENTDGQIRKKLTDLEKKLKMLKSSGEAGNTAAEVDTGALEDIMIQLNDLKE